MKFIQEKNVVNYAMHLCVNLSRLFAMTGDKRRWDLMNYSVQ
jgi:hypothetical protein